MDAVSVFTSDAPLIVSVLRALAASVLVLFLPGFAWSLVFFKKTGALERFALSIGLSVSIMTLAVLGLNIAFRVPITVTTALIVIFVFSAVPFAIYTITRIRARQREAARK